MTRPLRGIRARGWQAPRSAGRRPGSESEAHWPGPCADWQSFHLFLNEVGRDIERLVQHRQQAVALTLEDLESGVRDELDLLLEQVDPRERIAVAGQKQRWALDPPPVRGAELVWKAWRVQRIGETDQAAEVRLHRGHAGDHS